MFKIVQKLALVPPTACCPFKDELHLQYINMDRWKNKVILIYTPHQTLFVGI